MQPFTRHEGLAAPLDRPNVDTDAIIPKQFLTSIRRTGYGPNLFDAWRYLDTGRPGQDCATRPLNPDFVLNDPRLAGATVLLARDNFGCGSSREHAVWALAQYGFRAVIAPSFGDIFFHNALRNGLLCIALPAPQVAALFDTAAGAPLTVTIDLAGQVVGTATSALRLPFDIDPFRKACLLRGADDIDLTLERAAHLIRAFEHDHRRFPWLAAPVR